MATTKTKTVNISFDATMKGTITLENVPVDHLMQSTAMQIVKELTENLAGAQGFKITAYTVRKVEEVLSE